MDIEESTSQQNHETLQIELKFDEDQLQYMIDEQIRLERNKKIVEGLSLVTSSVTSLFLLIDLITNEIENVTAYFIPLIVTLAVYGGMKTVTSILFISKSIKPQSTSTDN